MFDKTEFQTEVPKQFVLVEVDFPRAKKISDELKKQNGELAVATRSGVFRPFWCWIPTANVVAGPVIAPAGRGIRQTPGGVRGNVREHPEAEAGIDSGPRLERAKVLDQLIDGYVKLGSEIDELPAWRKEIIGLDPDNKAGLRAKHEFRLLLAECAELRRAGKFERIQGGRQEGDGDSRPHRPAKAGSLYDPVRDVPRAEGLRGRAFFASTRRSMRPATATRRP